MGLIPAWKKLHKPTPRQLVKKTGFVLLFCGIAGSLLFGIQTAVTSLISLFF